MQRDCTSLVAPLAGARFAIVLAFGLAGGFLAAEPRVAAADALSPGGPLNVRVSWGYRTPRRSLFYVDLRGTGLSIARSTGWNFEADDRLQQGLAQSHAGGGDVDGVDCLLEYPPATLREVANLNAMWRDLIALSDPDTARRLKADPAYRRDDRRLTVHLDREGTCGFSLTADQLASQRSFWVPALDVYVAAGEELATWEQHRGAWEPFVNRRILDQVHGGSEASLEEYLGRWEDMGSPLYRHPSQPEPGHVICVAWDSALYKFGIDRGAGVRNDLGNPDRFRLGFEFGALNAELGRSWRGQRLTDGLPVIATTIERNSVRHEVEQFAYPLEGPPAERGGDVPMVLLQSLRLTNLVAQPRKVSFRMTHQRGLRADAALQLRALTGGTYVCEETVGQGTALAIQGAEVEPDATAVEGKAGGQAGAKEPLLKPIALVVSVHLPPEGQREVWIKLPSPVVPAAERARLLALDVPAARRATLTFWEEYLAQGAQFVVPEPAVNELFRANLWHALRLPRRHGGAAANPRIDLPYSNFAYGQQGIPWPINHGVYVDYMLYDLRGYHRLSAEELSVIYRDTQEPSGRIRGYGNWMAYTPSMVYAAAQHFLLSGDRDSWGQLLVPTLRAADWCLAEVRKGEATGGLVRGPLNDLTGDGEWAFHQAYVYAAFDRLAAALDRSGHARAAEFRRAAGTFRSRVERAFAAAAVRSPLVQLRDRTWSPYVPSEARSSGRRLDQWYPTDVDTGALHLPRLKALPADGLLADWLLHDHEDNLYLHGWGMANEPVYNPQATVYLLRDDPVAAIRAFYSYLACAFSHGPREPVEHRWTWGQYFGPPSTDGAWFELYRNMLIQERDDDCLLLLAAVPRKWLADGQVIEVREAPTYFGPLHITVRSRAAQGAIHARIQMPQRNRLKELVVRLRHPQGQRMTAVKVNGKGGVPYEPDKEWVRIAQPDQASYEIVASY